MLRKNVFGIMLALLLISMLKLASNIQSVKASGTIYIRAGGSVDPSTAPISTTDNVTYTFTDNINDSIVVERDGILIDGASYILKGVGTGKGIDLSHRSNVTIRNVEISEFSIAVELCQSLNNTVSENKVTNNFVGIHLWQSSNNTISRNNVITSWAGIYLGFSPNNMILRNEFVGCGLVVDSFSSVAVDNTVNGKPLVYLENVSNYVVSYAGQVILMNCENIRVEGTYLSNASVGISLCGTNNTQIASNNITNNAIGGISLAWSSNNSICGNKIINNIIGIDLWDSSNNTLSGNVMSRNKYSLSVLGSKLEDFLHSIDVSNLIDSKPVYYWVNEHVAEISSEAGYIGLVNCTEIVVKNLTLTNNGEGLLLAYTQYSYISNNTMVNNSYGIHLFESANNTISGNEVINNWCGIRTYYSSDNPIYHNNFIDNTYQINAYYSINAWDDGYPSGGNYWSDYNGTDVKSGRYQNETGFDWIGDSPYVIDERNQDRYPLMYPFVPEMEEMRIAYRNLLLKYTEICSDLNGLNFTLYELLGNVTELQGKYDSLLTTINDMQKQIHSLNLTCKDLQKSIDDLMMTFNSTCSNLQDQINSLNSTLQERIDSLNFTTQTSIDDLRKDVMTELGNIRNLMYAFIATTVILIATTICFAIRKPKVKPEIGTK